MQVKLGSESYIAPVASLATALDSAWAQYMTPTGRDHHYFRIEVLYDDQG